MDIPKPPRGYWAKLRAGKPVSIKPLPQNDEITQKMGVRTGTTAQRRTDNETLAFLSDEERELILTIASQILLPGEGARMYPKLSAHRQVINEWRKEHKSNDSRGRSRQPAPALAETVSDETIHRVYRIIEALIGAME